MKRLSRSLLWALTFVAGCATGGAASQLVTPANAAPPPPGTPRWTYACFKSDDVERIQDRASRLGAEGWELASSALAGGANTSSPIWCFKRPY
jgi:hypothetical protein